MQSFLKHTLTSSKHPVRGFHHRMPKPSWMSGAMPSSPSPPRTSPPSNTSSPFNHHYIAGPVDTGGPHEIQKLITGLEKRILDLELQYKHHTISMEHLQKKVNTLEWKAPS